MLVLLLACARPPPAPPAEPLPTAYHDAAAAEAAALVPDPARGGPPLHPDASPLPPFRGVDRATARYVGAETCAACHAAAAAVWAGSKHAHSLRALEGAGRSFDPRCLGCHVTGLGHPGGFGPGAAADLAAVGCEACHGPGSAHVAAPGAGYGELPAGPAACVGCHNHDNSPDFRWESRWPAVHHEL